MATAPPLLNRDIDTVSALLIAQLALDDINEYYRTTGHDAGSGTGFASGSAPSDEEYAFQLQAEDYRQFMSAYGDHRLSLGLQGVPLPEPKPVEDADADAGSPGGNEAIVPDYDDPLVDNNDSEPEDDSVFSPDDNFLIEPTHPPSPLARPLCVVCTEPVPPTSFKAPCDHYFCTSCLEQYLATCIDNEQIFPPRCCGESLHLDHDDLQMAATSTSLASSSSSLYSLRESIYGSVGLNLDGDLLTRFRKKSVEFQVIPNDRVYCPNPHCSRFLGSWDALKAPKQLVSISQLISLHSTVGLSSYASTSSAPLSISTPTTIECHSCRTTICLTCKEHAHPDKTCQGARKEEDIMAEAQLRELAKERKWQTCPGCTEMVELNGGCNHVVCRCRKEFCYICGRFWPAVARGGEGVCICR